VSHSVHEAHSLVAVESCPSALALTALSLGSVVILEAVREMVDARSCFVFVGVSNWVEELVLALLFPAICRVETVSSCVLTARSLRALFFWDTATQKVHSPVI
jgi:hypothetical protein